MPEILHNSGDRVMSATTCYQGPAVTRKVLIAYYGATALFLLLDFWLGLNVRVAFLEPFTGWRLAYYLFCFLCLALVVWRPAISVIVGAFESLVTLSALIISFGTRVILASAHGVVSMPEIVNFLISGSIGYLVWTRGMRELQQGFRADPDT